MALKVKVTFGELLAERGMSLNELSTRSNVRRAALSELVNGKRENINFEHIVKIAEALGTNDISKIIMLVDSEK
ncbi:MAG: helix-turn-helix transcriptional regulator [Paenibacillus macerans]|uniref:Helix-turn-helix domain-containing protein n=1 Tax=Paenibacillus macerans TaxID=44252 RepID=A0A090ZJ70_PAEMA|nr:helix-turn-helix transcriptional regulator [Paenibacillus macerans]KFN10448.1 helix-turn-helix family protein [Paenibacillus macerans]MBS5910429.1 helix-turn-helix transcriptional regulator [Paenibacillus macerans]MCM3700617.1 helix-turn-helix transcriptional regulator [Paenibacillus macerans]MCY7557435.1 helix-turn-helix transcriptional regulator [Paenibacillus macerans]MDU5945621.1 helix-turn-helix transcriptional regulator [Paenibacillus macerans]